MRTESVLKKNRKNIIYKNCLKNTKLFVFKNLFIKLSHLKNNNDLREKIAI